MFGIARPRSDSGCLLRGVVQQQAHFFRAETRRTASGRASAEGRYGAVCAAVSSGLVAGAAHAHGNTRANVIPESDRAHEVSSADCVLLAGGKGRWNNGDTRMRAGRAMRVVGFVGMREHAVRECGFDGAADDVGSDNRGDLLTAIGTGELQGRATGWQDGA